jgi:hypothetical protein
MARWAEQYAESLRSANPVMPILKFDMWIAADLCIVIDSLLFHHSGTRTGADSLLLLAQDTGHPLPEAPESNSPGVPGEHLITVVVLVALLVAMPWWSDGLSPKAQSVLSEEVGLLALAAAVVQMFLSGGR